MQGRKIKLKTTGEIYNFLQFESSSKTLDDHKQVISLAVVAEDKNGDIYLFSASEVQFVKEEPIKTKEEILKNNNYIDEDGFIDIIAIHKSMEEYGTQCLKEYRIKSETTGIDRMKHKAESTTNDFLEKLKAKIDSMSQEELNASWEAVKDNGNNKFYLTYFEYEAPKRFRIIVEPLD